MQDEKYSLSVMLMIRYHEEDLFFMEYLSIEYKIPLPPLLLWRSPGTPPPQAPFKNAKIFPLFLLTSIVSVDCKDFWRCQKCKRGLMNGGIMALTAGTSPICTMPLVKVLCQPQKSYSFSVCNIICF